MKKKPRILYLGLDPTRYEGQGEIIHAPIIKIQPRSLDLIAPFFRKIDAFSTLLFTSRVAVSIFFEMQSQLNPNNRNDWKLFNINKFKEKRIIAVGKATGQKLTEFGVVVAYCAEEERAEGVVSLLKNTPEIKDIFYPHSSLARDVIDRYLKENSIRHLSFALYDTKVNPISLPSEADYDVIVFTSPSTVDAYLELKGKLPPFEKCQCIGPITKAYLKRYLFHFFIS